MVGFTSVEFAPGPYRTRGANLTLALYLRAHS